MNKYERAALQSANRIRKAAFGLPPVDHLYKGEKMEEANCPITNTILDDDLERGDQTIDTVGKAVEISKDMDDLVSYPLSATAYQFVQKFDDGEFPHLILDPEEE